MRLITFRDLMARWALSESGLRKALRRGVARSAIFRVGPRGWIKFRLDELEKLERP
jgi:hypothetical protein